MNVAGLTRKGRTFRGGGNRYRGRERNVGTRAARTVVKSTGAVRWGLWIVLGFILLAGLSLGLLFSYRWATSSRFFSVKTVEVAGNVRLSPEQVLERAGITAGMNCLAANMKDVERKLLADPWVEHVAVERRLPDGFKVEIRELNPRFWVLKEGELWYADESGRLVAPVESDKFTPLPILTVAPGVRNPGLLLAGLVELDRRSALPFSLSRAASLALKADKTLEIGFDAPERIFILECDDIEQGSRRLALVWEDLERRRETGGVNRLTALGGEVWVTRAGE